MTKLRSGLKRLRAVLAAEPNSRELWERSRTRWRAAQPVNHLTWARDLNGDAFVSRMESYDVFNPTASLLEIGPGYGRLLKSIISRQLSFSSYLGVDISPHNIDYLNRTFAALNVEFKQGDIEKTTLAKEFDVVFSSLTFKHLFPTFEAVLANVTRELAPRGWVFFDLIEGSGHHFENDGVTFLRHYPKTEVLEILARCGLQLAAWDEVLHTPEHKRLLVVARKSV
jgi:SAM-dependent methyltransferase